jgi:hypothetical protein
MYRILVTFAQLRALLLLLVGAVKEGRKEGRKKGRKGRYKYVLVLATARMQAGR